jgi:hypothetical protein
MPLVGCVPDPLKAVQTLVEFWGAEQPRWTQFLIGNNLLREDAVGPMTELMSNLNATPVFSRPGSGFAAMLDSQNWLDILYRLTPNGGSKSEAQGGAE